MVASSAVMAAMLETAGPTSLRGLEIPRPTDVTEAVAADRACYPVTAVTVVTAGMRKPLMTVRQPRAPRDPGGEEACWERQAQPVKTGR